MILFTEKKEQMFLKKNFIRILNGFYSKWYTFHTRNFLFCKNKKLHNATLVVSLIMKLRNFEALQNCAPIQDFHLKIITPDIKIKKKII